MTILKICLVGVLVAFNVMFLLSSPKRLLERQPGALANDLAMIQGNTLLPIAPIVEISILDDPEVLEELIKKYMPELDRIIFAESEWNSNACNDCAGTKWEGLYNPNDCPCGAGLGGIIPTTKKHCEEKLERSLDAFNKVDNLQCSIWLYVNEGNHHWRQSEYRWKQ